MKPLERILKTLAVRFAVSPLDTLTDICRRLLPGREVLPQVLRLQEITRQTPLILQIETTNVCNARCVFCAYPKMKREKGIMSMPLFERIVQEYAAMAGIFPAVLGRLRSYLDSWKAQAEWWKIGKTPNP